MDYNGSDPSLNGRNDNRDSIVAAHMHLKENEYTESKHFRIFVGTWNVNGQLPQESPISNWLACDPSPPDLYAIGFQELDLSTEAYLFTHSPYETLWLQLCQKSLHPKAQYTLVKLVRLVGMMLIVFVKNELAQNVTNVEGVSVGTGLMGKMGNKGGVAVRLDLHNTSLCFVNSHLAAHVEECTRRNQDYNEIYSRTLFVQTYPPKYIKDHDQIYWFGDLNYRIDDLSTDEIKARIENNEFSYMLNYDQLKKQMRLRKVFTDFEEPPIKHYPTYKYNPGTNEWDSSEKNRPPAWCDRVLYRSNSTRPLTYRSHPSLLLSDHKPVSCLFDSTIKVINDQKYAQVQEKVMRQLDRMENDKLPQVVLDRNEIIFDNVSKTEPVVTTLKVQNTGSVPTTFGFKTRINRLSFCKPWLQVSPNTGLLNPGDILDLEFRVFVGEDSIDTHGSDAQKKLLDDILILSLERGKDFFIEVKVNLRDEPKPEEEPLIQL